MTNAGGYARSGWSQESMDDIVFTQTAPHAPAKPAIYPLAPRLIATDNLMNSL